MRNTSLHQNGAPSDSWRSRGTFTAADFAIRPTTLKCIIDRMERRLGSRPLMTSRRFAENVIELSRRSSGSDVIGRASSALPMPSGESRPTALPPDGYRRLRLRIIGVSPLIMHNGRLADPINPISREMKRVSAKRAKTDADFEELARLEFMGSLYLSGGEPCIPGELFEACLIQAAKKVRRGVQARAAIICDGNFTLEYDGPRAPLELWEDERFRFVAGVRVAKARVMRTRPRFDSWSATIDVDYLPDQLDGREIVDFANVAGRVVGLGDWRPRFGRFSVEA